MSGQCKASVETPDGQAWLCVLDDGHPGPHETTSTGPVKWWSTREEKLASYRAEGYVP